MCKKEKKKCAFPSTCSLLRGFLVDGQGGEGRVGVCSTSISIPPVSFSLLTDMTLVSTTFPYPHYPQCSPWESKHVSHRVTSHFLPAVFTSQSLPWGQCSKQQDRGAAGKMVLSMPSSLSSWTFPVDHFQNLATSRIGKRACETWFLSLLAWHSGGCVILCLPGCWMYGSWANMERWSWTDIMDSAPSPSRRFLSSP